MYNTKEYIISSKFSDDVFKHNEQVWNKKGKEEFEKQLEYLITNRDKIKKLIDNMDEFLGYARDGFGKKKKLKKKYTYEFIIEFNGYKFIYRIYELKNGKFNDIISHQNNLDELFAKFRMFIFGKIGKN